MDEQLAVLEDPQTSQAREGMPNRGHFVRAHLEEVINKKWKEKEKIKHKKSKYTQDVQERTLAYEHAQPARIRSCSALSRQPGKFPSQGKHSIGRKDSCAVIKNPLDGDGGGGARLPDGWANIAFATYFTMPPQPSSSSTWDDEWHRRMWDFPR